MPKLKTDDKGYIVAKCEELIKNFNPVTHSIDTHCYQYLGDVTVHNAKPENVFIQQVVYGWYRERRVLEVTCVTMMHRFYANKLFCGSYF